MEFVGECLFLSKHLFCLLDGRREVVVLWGGVIFGVDQIILAVI